MTCGLRGALCLAILAHGCARSSTTSSSSGVSQVPDNVPDVVCPRGTDRETRPSAKEVETYCVQTLPPVPGVDVGPAKIRTGPSVSRFLDGKASSYGDYAEDVRVGAWRYFHRDGTKLAEGRYEKGSRVGLWTEWRSNGKLRTEATYVKGQLEGAWRNVWRDVVVGEGEFTANAPSGHWTSHFCAGGVHETLTLSAGKLDGPCTRFQAGGQKYLEGNYRDGKKSGVWRQSATNGVRFESTWADDARDGPFRWYAPDGHVVMQGALRGGKLDGRWVVRDDAGQISKEGVYDQGKLAQGAEVTSVLKLNGYETNAYCAYNLQGFTPLPSTGGPYDADGGDLAKVVCDRF